MRLNYAEVATSPEHFILLVQKPGSMKCCADVITGTRV